jgi:hypothetical protein
VSCRAVLTSAMCIDASGREVECPDPACGLYVRTQHGDEVQVRRMGRQPHQIDAYTCVAFALPAACSSVEYNTLVPPRFSIGFVAG